MSEIHVVALITPAEGKEARVKELLLDLGNKVKEYETDVHKYEIFEQYNGEGQNVFVVEDIYANKAAHEGHFKTEYFTALGQMIQEEGLLAAPLDIKTIKPIGGFGSR